MPRHACRRDRPRDQGGSAQTWTYAYGTWGDDDALQVTVMRPDAETVVYKYNANGTLASVDAPDVGEEAMITEFEYDGLGRLLVLRDPADNETLWSYDAAGRVLTETIMKTPTGPSNVTQYGYNPDGQIALITDAMGQTFEYGYDDDNRLDEIVMTDTAEVETTKTILYSFDTSGKTELWTVSVGSDAVVMQYNEHGLLDYIDGVLAGNADRVQYGYDADYRLTELGYYIYDTGNYVLWTTEYDYDEFGRLETIEDRLGLTSTYAYNNDFSLKSLTLPNGTVTEYTYDDLRRLVSIATTGLSANDIIVRYTYHYNNLGLRDSVTMHDGRTTEWAYDDVGRLIEEHFKSGGPSPETLLRYVYTYDAAGNRSSKKTDYDDNDSSFAATATYTNNGYNQLTAVSGTPGHGTKVNVTGTIPTAWTLADGDITVTPNSTPGNAVEAEVRGGFFIARNVALQNGDNTLVASTSEDTLAGNSLSSDTVEDVALDTSIDEDYTCDANGNLIVKSEENGAVLWTYSYDVQGWLVKVEGPDSFVEEYTYDPIGRKISIETTESTGTTERCFVYDGGSIILETEKVGTSPNEHYELANEHVRGASLGGGIGGLLYTRAADGSLGYFHYDGQGNVVSVTDESRTEVAYYEYDAWGNVLTRCGSLANEFAFSTKQASLGSGLIDFGYRWYDPQTGRWTQRDPAGYVDGGNLYAFGLDSPPNSFDSWGGVIEVYTEEPGGGWKLAGKVQTEEGIDAFAQQAAASKQAGHPAPFGYTQLQQIALTVCGKELLSGLAASDKVVKIYVYTSRKAVNRTDPDDVAAGVVKDQELVDNNGQTVKATGEGTGCEIHYEANTTRKADGFSAYADEVLVHELQRAWDFVTGTYDITVVDSRKNAVLRQADCSAVEKMNEYIREKEGASTSRQRGKYGGFELPKDE
ncbi:MAG: RHS repeat-associated core domain-containing protein [Verrucomicrobia bacterium]|nr:RHS repeat-associated core domain-containing protein [Verrucomicrobiota bacterium]